eukprot:GHVU01190912.1.p1 GENE.GHVU01190912.1~~GHVU01190912.1.p1  ORF type:complete len:247 (+),score=20.83 GHVU01190912.1:171-911(+)
MSNEFGRSSRTRPQWRQDAYQNQYAYQGQYGYPDEDPYQDQYAYQNQYAYQDQYAYQNQDSYWSEDYYSSEDSYSSEDADQAEDADAYVYPAGAWWPWGGNDAWGGTSNSRMAIAYRITDDERGSICDRGRVKDGGTCQRALLLAALDALKRLLKSIRRNDGLLYRHRDRETVVNVVTRNEITVNTFNTWVNKWPRPEFRDQFFRSNRKASGSLAVLICWHSNYVISSTGMHPTAGGMPAGTPPCR